jgi:DNA-binding transcriptional MocR family regulator
VDLWRRRAIDRGVYFMIGRQFTLDASPLQAVRFGFALLDDRESATAISRLAASLPVRRRRTK